MKQLVLGSVLIAIGLAGMIVGFGYIVALKLLTLTATGLAGLWWLDRFMGEKKE